MKKVRAMALAAVAGGMVTAAAQAQPGAAAGAAPAAAGPAVAAAKPGFFEKVCVAMEKKKRKLCASPAGAMLNKIVSPLSRATGGIIPPFCPAMPSLEEQAAPGVAGAAAQAKADAAAAAARVKDVQFLGTLDCHWHPEAEAGLVLALRTDRNECVRLAAAVALNRGCCCTKAIIEALEDCVSGREKFGPYENSPRVQEVAALALEHCLTCYREVAPEEIKGKEPEPEKKGAAPEMTADDAPGAPKPAGKPVVAPAPAPVQLPATVTSRKYSGPPSRELVDRARISLSHWKAKAPPPARVEAGMFPSGQRSLVSLAQYVIHGPAPRTTVTVDQTPAGAPTYPAIPPTAVPPQALVPQPQPQVIIPAHPPQAATPAQPLVPVPAAAQPAPQPQPRVSARPKPLLPPPEPEVAIGQPESAPAARATPPVESAGPRSASYAPAAGLERPAAVTPAAAVASRPADLPLAVETGTPRQIDPTILRYLETLRDAPDAEVRHGAVRKLALCNWRDNPEVLAGLLYGARSDKHPAMRVVCVRSLAAMKACTPEVMTGLQPLTADADDWVRQETAQALAQLSATAKAAR